MLRQEDPNPDPTTQSTADPEQNWVALTTEGGLTLTTEDGFEILFPVGRDDAEAAPQGFESMTENPGWRVVWQPSNDLVRLELRRNPEERTLH